MPKITIYKTNSMKNAAEYVQNRLKLVDKSDLSRMHTVIVPDRASLEAERALLKAVGGSFNVQVRTFRRLANEILEKHNYLSKQSGIMALTVIIRQVKSQLVCYTKGADTEGFVADMYDVISMMKYCKISPEMLMRSDLPKSVQGKAHDIALLYRAYCDFTADRYVDSADKLELLRERMPTSKVVTDGYFYLYDFDNFSAQEMALVEQLALCSLGVTVACCTSGERDKYLYLNDIYDGVMRICRQNGIVPDVNERRSYNNDIARQIGDNMYRYDGCERVDSHNFVEIYRGDTRAKEVYALACRVQKYVRSGGRYKDIYVVTSDINKYVNSVTTIFEQFNIPYFCDRPFELSNHPYARFIADYITLCRNNGKLNNVLPFVKNYLFFGGDDEQTEDDVYVFENYCLKYNVSYDYSHFDLGKSESDFQRADRFRAKFDKLYRAVQFPRSATAAQYVDIIQKLVETVRLNEKNAAFAALQQQKGLVYESKVTLQAQQKYAEVLAQAKSVLGEQELKLDEFIKVLGAAVASVNISVIPVKNDCVVFANMAKARKHDIKFLAMLGANYGAMPIVKKDCKLLSDRNIEDLTIAGLNVEPQISTENKRERFSLYQLLLEPTEKLYVSYALSDGADALVPSRFVTELSRLFSLNGAPLAPSSTEDEETYTEQQALAKIVLNERRLRDGQPVTMPAFNLLRQRLEKKATVYRFEKDGKKVCVQNGAKLYLKNLETSVSKLTDFYKCPYRFYLQYGLGVKPRSVADLNSADLGNILHETLELFVRGLDASENDETSAERAEKCFSTAISDDYYKGMRNNVQLAGALEQLKTEALRMCNVVKLQLSGSSFVNKAVELAFGNKADLPPVEVGYDGGKFLLIGKIDRVDVWDDKFLVIDYKSGAAAAHYTEKDLYVGHKLQLLVYLKAVQTFYGYMPAGFYYFNMHNNFTDVNAEKVYVYNGRTLCDVETATAIDNALSDGSSEKLGLRLTKDGALNRQGGKLLNEQQFQNQMEYSVRMIKQAGKLMQQGYAAVSPYKGACDVCDYRDVCDFGDVYTYNAREVTDSVTRETIDKTVQDE